MFKGRNIILDVKLKGQSIPFVSASAISHENKNHLFVFLILAQSRQEIVEFNLTDLDEQRLDFLLNFKDCFSKAHPEQLPPDK